jgi:methyl-accepting chemotaxis protein
LHDCFYAGHNPKGLMMKPRLTVSYQLAVFFALSLLATIGTGALGFLANHRTLGDLEHIHRTTVPSLEKSVDQVGALTLLRLETVSYLGQPLFNLSAQENIQALAASYRDTFSASEADEQPAQGSALLSALTSTLESHQSASAYYTIVDGAILPLTDFFEIVSREHAEVLEFIDKKARYGELRGLNTNADDTRLAKWAQGFAPNDPELETLVSSALELERGILHMVAKDIADTGKVKELTATRVQKAPRIKLNRAMTLLNRAAQERSDTFVKAVVDARDILNLTFESEASQARAAQAQGFAMLDETFVRSEQLAIKSEIGIVIAIAIGTIVALGASVFAWKRIGQPMAQLAQLISDLSKRDFAVAVPFTKRGDEIGQIARAADILRIAGRDHEAELRKIEEERDGDQARAFLELASGLNRLANRDLSAPIETELAAEYEELRSDFNATQAALIDAITQIANSSSRMNTSISGIASATEDLSDRTGGSANELQKTAATLQRMTELVKAAAQGATEAEGIAKDAKTNVELSTAVLSETVQAMRDLDESSDKIVAIVDMVDDIAFQTNLLALNASVEAARAGAAGKGFNVVATEVRLLAMRSSEAAREIGTLINVSGEQISKGVSLVDRVSHSLETISHSVNDVSDRVAEIAQSAQDQSMGLSDINASVGELEHSTQQNVSLFESTARSTRLLSEEAKMLSDTAHAFVTPPVDETGQEVKSA